MGSDKNAKLSVKENNEINKCQIFMQRAKLSIILLFSITSVFFSCSNDDNSIESIEFEIKPSTQFNEKFLICHRGLDGYPENTKIAIESAIKAGYRAVECDIAITKDSIPVLSHDRTIDCCSNGEGRISDMTYQELLQYDFGTWKDERFAGEKILLLMIY